MTIKNNQSGMASIVVVSMLVIILTLISVGYARIMSRTLNSSVNNQLGSAAYYAARSAISDATAYLATNPNTVADDCDDLLGTDGEGLQPASKQFSDASGEAVSYKCILIDQTPTELSYQKIDAFKSQVVKVTPVSGNISRMLFSWQSSTDNTNLPTFPRLYSHSSWAGSKYTPLLRVAIYPVVSDSEPVSNLASRTKTFFLYPSSGGVEGINYSASPVTANGMLQEVHCDSGASGYSGSLNFCNLDINLSVACGAGSCAYYYVRLTPFYDTADIKLRALNSTNAAIEFAGVQAVIDATAKSNSSTRRLQAAVDISSTGSNSVNIAPSDNAIPENAIRSATTLCKRLNVNQTGGNPVNGIDSSATAYCNLTLN